MSKVYGKLSLPQFQELVRKLPEIRSQAKELPAIVTSARPEVVREILDKDFHGADVYELPLLQHIALLIFAFGRVQKIQEISGSPDPQQAALDWAETDDLDDWNGGEGGVFKEKHLVGLVVALQRSILSIMLYHRTLSALVEEVRAGNDISLFLAVRVDRSMVACPTFADRIARAELENDTDFFRHLRSALKGPSKKHWEAYHDLRYALFLLRELGFDQMSDSQLEDLLVHQLKVYSPHANARKNLRKQFTQSKKIATT